MDRETIHNEFTAIDVYDQEYRIRTKVEFTPSGTFKCIAWLYKSFSGIRGDLMYKQEGRTTSINDVDRTLQNCIDMCREKMRDIEQAKALQIDVTVK